MSQCPSYHPVQTLGRNPDVPGLIAPYNERSTTACTDCHGSEASGRRGPHGSAFKPILKANFQPESGHPESAQTYALCYRCHSRTALLSDTGFKEHRKHVQDAKASCRACHNSHGSVRYPHLIDFDTKVVFSSRTSGRLTFEDLGSHRGACSLLCHGKDHDQQTYGEH